MTKDSSEAEVHICGFIYTTDVRDIRPWSAGVSGLSWSLTL